MEVESVGQSEQQGDQGDDGEGKEVNGCVERDQEQRSQRDDTCACDVGMNVNLSFCHPLSQSSVRTSEQRKNSQGTMTPTTRTRDYKNKQAKLCSIHSVHESLDVLVSSHMLHFILHVFVLVALCDEFSCCQCTKLIHFLTNTGIPYRDSHCESGLVRCSLHLPNDPTATKIKS